MVLLASSRYDISWAWKNGIVGIHQGCFILTVGPPNTPGLSWKPNGLAKVREAVGQVNTFIWEPRIVSHQRNSGGTAMVPFWIPLVFALAAAALFHRFGKPKPPGQCVKCSYNLAGNTSGVCPECGTRTWGDTESQCEGALLRFFSLLACISHLLSGSTATESIGFLSGLRIQVFSARFHHGARRIEVI